VGQKRFASCRLSLGIEVKTGLEITYESGSEFNGALNLEVSVSDGSAEKYKVSNIRIPGTISFDVSISIQITSIESAHRRILLCQADQEADLALSESLQLEILCSEIFLTVLCERMA
jgi:hypothetical protein